MKKLFAVILLLNLFAVCAFAQTPDKKCICPTVSVTGPNAMPEPGEAITFIASVMGGGDGEIIYNWSVDQGKIIEGQGTPVITVDKTGLEDKTITATVEITGDWCPVCDKMTASETMIGDPPVESRLFNKFRRSNCEEVLAQMDAFYVALQNNPSDTGYIIIYGSPRAIKIAERELRNAVRMRRFDSSRIVFLQGGGTDKKATLEFYLVPQGAEPPTPDEPPAPPVGEEDTFADLPAPDMTKPFIFSSEFADGIGGCKEELNIPAFADALKENPKSRGNIVIYESTQKLFRQKEKEILDQLTDEKGIERKRLKTFFKKVKPMSLQDGVELWLLP